jgi:hypothetical protein
MIFMFAPCILKSTQFTHQQMHLFINLVKSFKIYIYCVFYCEFKTFNQVTKQCNCRWVNCVYKNELSLLDRVQTGAGSTQSPI